MRRMLKKYRDAKKIDKYIYHELYMLAKGKFTFTLFFWAKRKSNNYMTTHIIHTRTTTKQHDNIKHTKQPFNSNSICTPKYF